MFCNPAAFTKMTGIRRTTTTVQTATNNQKFRKGVGGQRGLTRGDPSWHGPLFCALFPMPPLGEGEHNTRRSILAVFWPLFVANPLPPTPFRTSENKRVECWINRNHENHKETEKKTNPHQLLAPTPLNPPKLGPPGNMILNNLEFKINLAKF